MTNMPLASFLHARRALPVALWWNWCRALTPRPVLQFTGETAVSVIIPAYNQWEYTRACLCSILESGDDAVPYEIILVDDGSTDETTRAEIFFPGLRVVRMKENSGYIRACNAGAAWVKGRHILLLNNDTVVFPHWLHTLYTLMEHDERAAIIGSRICCPDGSMQNGGSTLWNDGSSSGNAVDDPPGTECVSFVREIDYAVGCCLLIRGDFWKAAGGYDEVYNRGYYDEIHLAMQARAAGFRVLYQPDSLVCHKAHASFNNERADAYSMENLRRFYTIWQETLKVDFLPPDTPMHLGIGNAQRSFLSSSKKRHRVGLYNLLCFNPDEETGKKLSKQFIEWIRLFLFEGHVARYVKIYDEIDGFIDYDKVSWTSQDILEDLPYISQKTLCTSGFGERIMSMCAEYNIDIVICLHYKYVKIFEYTPRYVIKILVIETMDDLHSGILSCAVNVDAVIAPKYLKDVMNTDFPEIVLLSSNNINDLYTSFNRTEE